MNAYASLQETGLGGKVVIITGGAQGIGFATAQRFCAEGCIVVIADLKTSPGADRALELRKLGFNATFMPLDVTNEADADAMADEVVDKHGQIDVLVNNAGITADSRVVFIDKKTGDLNLMSVEDWIKVLHVNLDGAFICTRAVLRHMFPCKSGNVLFASSVAAEAGNFGQANYVSSKKALIGLAETLMRELGPSGIRVNVVAPGFTATDMVKSVPQKVLDDLVGKTPLRRMARPEDIANVYVWLAGDQSAFVTGEVVGVNGGLRL